ncbi:MAG: tRNA (adenosine(37)-N6)-dimethylallyltransferase MiaA [Bacteroidia bacterium]|nr:tRNA (adenosine(37)-N6)-dimethylallyltransferase MiaA [Bacteroidia bacterium]MCF8427542.1 tRNA (adenosine(37)-N6)-dimethylallyltransferase MiaA [Bacteroidia bacterium]
MKSQNPYDCLVILGATASGKTKLAVEIAYQLNGEILSADSRMVYKKMDIGTGKDLAEYQFIDKTIPYHLMDLVEPDEHYFISRFQSDFKKAFRDIQKRNKLPIICGGSGLYLEAVLQDFVFTQVPITENFKTSLEQFSLDELQLKFKEYPFHEFQLKADLGTKKRAIRAIEIIDFLTQNPNYTLPISKPLQAFIIGLNPPLLERREKIIARLKHRINNGLIEEVESLLDSGISKERLRFFGLEYKFVVAYLEKELSKELLIERLGTAIQQFAKRQMTYFRKMEKSGLKIHWVQTKNEALEIITSKFYL